MNFTSWIFALVLSLVAEIAFAGSLTVSGGDFAVVTKPAGVGASLAHEHLISCPKPSIKASKSDSISFEFECKASDLLVDDLAMKKKLFPVMSKIGLLKDEPKEISEGDRKTIRENMLEPDQLDGSKHASIKAKLLDLQTGEFAVGSYTGDHKAHISLIVKGKEVKKWVAAKVKWEGNKFEVESVGKFKFSEFGIEPYSAALGAIRNADEFGLYVNFSGSED